MDWKQDLLKRLDVLAAKLGTTAAYLWSVLVRQAISDGISSAVGALVAVIGGVLAYKLTGIALRAFREDTDYFPGLFFSWVAVAVSIVACACFLTDAIQHFYNPAYYALHEVLESVGK